MYPGCPNSSPNYSHGTAGRGRGAGRRRTGPGPAGLRRRRASGRRAPARRGLAGRRRVRRPAHDPAVHARGGAGDLHLVPRAGRHLAAVRGAGPRRRGRGRRLRGRGAAGPLPALGARRPAYRSGSGPASGTTTDVAAARRGSATCCSTPPRTAPTRRGPTCSCGGRARWATRWSSARSATTPARGGGSWSTARTRRCCRPARPGCRAPPGSPPSCSAWPGSSTTGWTLRSSTAPTSGGPCRPGCARCNRAPEG